MSTVLGLSEDPFDSLLNLEDDFYNEGYDRGVTDGSRAGYLEGRRFGVEKGFEKFVSAARIHGRATVWAARLPPSSGEPSAFGTNSALVRLPNNPRLVKHIQTLRALVDPSTLSIENNEDAVSEMDDRLNRAKAKVKVIEKIIGEEGINSGQSRQTSHSSTIQIVQAGTTPERREKSENIEDVDMQHIRA